MEILLIDNYDSFTYNLLHQLRAEGGAECRITIVVNDRLEGVRPEAFDRVVVSPGPGTPSEAGDLVPFVRRCAGVRPLLGVCLGHHALAEAFGGRLVNVPGVWHGIRSEVRQTLAMPLWRGVPERFDVGRYHSWIVSREGLPAELAVVAETDDGTIMALVHRSLPLYGVQFHPESIMTPCGGQIIANFLKN